MAFILTPGAGERDDDAIIDLSSSVFGGKIILLAIIWLSIIKTNRDRLSCD